MKRKIAAGFLFCLLAIHSIWAQDQKELYLPDTIWKVPVGNDFQDSTSEYSFSRMRNSENLAFFWSKKLGNDPSINEDSTKTIDLELAVQECERFYNYYIDSLQFLEKGKSVSDRYKALTFIFGEEDGTAYGGGVEEIGMLWTPPARMHLPPYGALAHELGHSFQYLVHADGHWGFTSAPEGSHGHSLFEMTSQYMLWQVYPEWMTFENYHLKAFMDKTHFAFLHETNMYHSPYVLEYWSGKHGKSFIGKLWREAQEGEDAVMAYQRLTDISQSQFNDEIFDAYRRFVTWDLPRIEEVAKPYINQHHSLLTDEGKGWYRIDTTKCPQNYGYNAIQLQVPKAGTKVKLSFEGLTAAAGFRQVQTEKAGWRYGFLAVLENGERVYGSTLSASSGKSQFSIPEKTTHLWLVVSGAPSEHWQHLLDGKPENDEQWPYQIKLKGTCILPEIIK